MKPKRFAVILCLLVIGGMTAYSRAEGQQPSGPLVLTDEQDRYPLGRYLDILEDPTGDLTIEQIASPEYAALFTRGLGENTNFGFTQSAYEAITHCKE